MTDVTEDTGKPKKDPIAERQKRKKRNMMIAGGSVVVAFIVWFLLQPLKAGPDYGICRTYLETNLKYPTTLKITKYDEYEISSKSIRLFYTYADSYGNQRSDMIECILTQDPVNGYIADDIKINRESIGDEKLELFNKAIPGILLGQPDLTIPRPPDPDNLADLKRD